MKPILISICILSALIVVNSSCQKQVDYSSQIDSLKNSVTSLQKRSDSLAAALASTNQNLSTLAKSVDSIKIQLTAIQLQISQLNIQLTTTNANIVSINAQIVILNQQYSSLLAKLNYILAQLAITPSSLSNGLVAWYPFTGNVIDSSGNGNNGNVSGAVLTSDRFGNSNSAYSFNNVSDNINIPNLHQSNILQYSISGWFQKFSTSINKGGTIVSGDIPCNGPGGLRIFIGSTNQACFLAEFSSCSCNGIITTNQNYADNKWHHFAAILNASNGVISSSYFNIYIDSVLVSQIQYSQGNLSNVIAPINNQNLPTTIGNINSLGDFFQGKIDDIRIYNRVLTQAEIQYLSSH